MIRNARTAYSLLPLVAVCVIGLGCSRGPELAPVRGKITVNGQPMKDLKIEFQPEKGSSSTGYTTVTGEYVLKYTRDHDGALLGTHKVAISSPLAIEDEQGNWHDVYQIVPPQYNVNSDLVREVKAGENLYDFNVEVPGFEVPPPPPGVPAG